MTTARTNQVDLSVTPFYHCMSRCVRRSFLYGYDEYSGRDYSHRKGWIVERIKQLANAFCIQLCAYAVMSNHYHVVLKVDLDRARNLNLKQLLQRWALIYPKDAKRIETASAVWDKATCKLYEDKLRSQLTDISWYMRCVNEYIAKLANKEDDVTGRFWEGRFKSQALLDYGAVLSAMAYVDLNPIRAGLADTPETSDYTSIKERIAAYVKNKQSQPKEMAEFVFESNHELADLEFDLEDYFHLVDETGRVLRDDKKGSIPANLSPILARLNLTNTGWLKMVSELENGFYYAVGNVHNIREFSCYSKNRSAKNVELAQECYIPFDEERR